MTTSFFLIFFISFFCKGRNDCKIALPEMCQGWVQNVGNINSPKNCVLPWQMILWLNIQKVQHSATSRSSYRLYQSNGRYDTRGKTFKALKTFSDHTVTKSASKRSNCEAALHFQPVHRLRSATGGAAAAGSATETRMIKGRQDDCRD